MINGYEFMKLKRKKLPESWKEEGALEALEGFLQENWNQRSIFYADGLVTSRQQFIDFDVKDGIKLQNYIGTVIFKGEQLNIFPKIFKQDEDDFDTDDLQLELLISNLVYWLEYCDKLNFPFASMKAELSNSENLLELFITIYVHYAKNAMEKQRYYQYEDVLEEGTFIKGRIDINDYVHHKYMTGDRGKFRYCYSSFEFDNLLNRIIKCTCKFLFNITNQAANKAVLRNIIMKLADVHDANCTPYDCDRIHLSAMNNSYRILLSMSKMFLLNKVNSSNIGLHDSFCFLFPAEVLFEGFVGGFIKETFKHEAKVTMQTSDQYLAELVVDGEVISNAFMLREDILIETDDKIFVLDTKYKEIDRFNKVRTNKKLKISDNDMKQMAVYAVKRGATKLSLIYPLHRGEDPETMEVRYDIHLDDGKCIPVEIMKIPFAFSASKKETLDLMEQIIRKVID